MPTVFRKRKIDDTAFEACSVFDVNNDGVPDIVSGAYWYEGPHFLKRHKICEVAAIDGYHDDFCDYPMDVDGDGWTDIITASFWSPAVRWRKNPGIADQPWETFDIGPSACNETLRFFDIDGCGIPEIFSNAIHEPQKYFKLIVDGEGKGTGRFETIVIGAEPAGHGMGFADINGDGRMDIVLTNGWLEQPENPAQLPWKFHKEFELGAASVPILGHDITGNGLCDIIVGQGHDYGLHWLEQRIDSDGKRQWTKHEIDMTGSQFHDMQLVDIDNDGELELVTGKRYRAHNDGDPGAFDDIGIYYYKINKGAFEKHVIDYGPASSDASGCGIYFWIADLSGNGYPDIIAPGKEGLYLFENVGPVSGTTAKESDEA
ncbi:MAG: repeat protein [Paenibacillus sp.]|nr:repeat protein [Paenibacillus sp.]